MHDKMVTKVTGKRIRSTHQRKVLDWLADGGGTVTEVSDALSMRLPHASAALKKLRHSGDVVRDHDVIRGSKHRLSSQGLARLESDGLNRLKQLVQWPPPPGAKGIVLARESSMLLLGYASNPQGPLLGLPERPIDDEITGAQNSTGNTGASTNWLWALARDENPTWWDLETNTRVDAPSDPSPLSISAWMERPKVMGVVRARLLDDSKSWPLGVGSWFQSLPDGLWPELPQFLRDGDSSIGRAGNSGPRVSPRGGIQAKVGKRHDKAMLIRTMSSNSLCMADANLVGKSSQKLPFGILKFWLTKLHPRLKISSIEDRAQKLRMDLESKVSNASTRKLLSDFPGKEWSSKLTDFIDTRGISHRAAQSVLEYLLEESELPLVINWRWPVENDELNRLISDSRCRLVICESTNLALPFRLTSGEKSGKFFLGMHERLRLPISIDSRMEISIPLDWIEPSAPNKIEWRELGQHLSDAKNKREAIWIACSIKEGDSAWADKHESKYPLASWIATPEEERVSRWRRIGDKLSPEWILLARLESLEMEMLCDASLYVDDAFTKVIQRIRKDPLSLLNFNSLLNHPAMASALLCSIDWFEDLPQIESICIAFKENPLRLGEVMRTCWNKPIISLIISACPFHLALKEHSNITREQIIGIIEDVHFSLWKDDALDWLRILIASTSGRSILSTLSIPWPILLCDVPLSSDTLHLVHHMDEGPGKDSLLDVLDGLEAREQGIRPSYGRTHPLSGWLFQPMIPLPPLDFEGDLEIHIELHRRFHD